MLFGIKLGKRGNGVLKDFIVQPNSTNLLFEEHMHKLDAVTNFVSLSPRGGTFSRRFQYV